MERLEDARDLPSLIIANRTLHERVNALQHAVTALSGALVSIERMLTDCQGSLAVLKNDMQREISRIEERLPPPNCTILTGEGGDKFQALDDHLTRLEESLNHRDDAVVPEAIEPNLPADALEDLRAEFDRKFTEDRCEIANLRFEMEQLRISTSGSRERMSSGRKLMPSASEQLIVPPLSIQFSPDSLVQLGWISKLGGRLYHAENGWDIDEFHRKCDGKAPTLTLIRTAKGSLFGGVSVLPTDSGKDRFLEDPTRRCFVFILSSPKVEKAVKFQLKRGQKAFYVGKNFGPHFGEDGTFKLRRGVPHGICPNSEYGINDVSLFDGADDGRFDIASFEVWAVAV